MRNKKGNNYKKMSFWMGIGIDRTPSSCKMRASRIAECGAVALYERNADYKWFKRHLKPKK